MVAHPTEAQHITAHSLERKTIGVQTNRALPIEGLPIKPQPFEVHPHGGPPIETELIGAQAFKASPIDVRPNGAHIFGAVTGEPATIERAPVELANVE